MSFYTVERTVGSFYTGGVVAVRNGKFMYSAIEDSLVETDLESGSTERFLISEGDSIATFAVSQDASIAIIITKSSLMWVFDLESKEVIKSWKSHSSTPLACCLDAQNEVFVVGFSDRSLRVWDVECGSCLSSIKGFSSLASHLSIPFSQDPRLFCGTSEGKIFCFDYRSGKCLGKADAHSSIVTSLAFSLDEKQSFASFSRDKVVGLWTLPSEGGIKAAKSLMVFEAVEAGCFVSGDIGEGEDKIVAIGGDSGAVSLWNLSKSKLICKESPREGQSIGQIHLFSSGILSISSEHSIRSLSLPALKCNFTLQGHKGEITDLAVLDSSLVVATNNEKIKVYDRSRLFDSQELKGHTAIVLCLDAATFQEESFIVSGAKDHTVRLWRRKADSPTFELVFTCQGHTEAVGAVAFCKKNLEGLVFLSASEDKTIKAWKWDGEKAVATFTIKGHEKDINSLAVAPNDQIFASCSQDKTAKIWSFEGKLRGTLSGHKRGISSIQFHPTEQLIATCSADKTIKIWSPTSFQCVKTLEGHTSSILKVSFIGKPPGAQLVSISSDGLVKIWNVKNSECIATYDEHTDKIWALSHTPDFSQMYTGGADAQIKVWRNITEEKRLEEIQKENQMIETSQKLDNLLWKKDFKNAISLAFQLEQPKKLLFILKELHKESPELLPQALEAIPAADLPRLIGYCREWNTSFHNSPVAQAILSVIVASHHWEKLLEEVPEMHKNIEALLPYTQRHIQRLDEMNKKVMLIDFILSI